MEQGKEGLDLTNDFAAGGASLEYLPDPAPKSSRAGVNPLARKFLALLLFEQCWGGSQARFDLSQGGLAAGSKDRSGTGTHGKKAAQAVRFEVCDCAEAALARELQLIQQHRPTYNRALNGNPLHPYVALDLSRERAVLRLADTPEESAGEVYGAFRGVGRCRMVLQALGRLFWCCAHPGAGVWDLPLRLGSASWAREVEAAAPGEACGLLVDYLAGARNGLTEWFTEHLESADAHLRCLLENDLLVVAEFFAWGPEWNRRISELHGLPRVIPRGELDALRLKTRRAVKLARDAAGNQSGDLR